MTAHVIRPIGWTGWNDTNIATLKAMMADGRSFGQIAKVLGCTRNAALGKAMRTGLRSITTPIDQHTERHVRERIVRDKAPPRPRPEPRHRPTPSAPSFGPWPSPTPIAPAPIIEREHAGPVISFADLKRGCCKWPVGDPASDGFGFCGAAAEGRRSFCPDHTQIAFKAPKKDDSTKAAKWIHNVDGLGHVLRW